VKGGALSDIRGCKTMRSMRWAADRAKKEEKPRPGGRRKEFFKKKSSKQAATVPVFTTEHRKKGLGQGGKGELRLTWRACSRVPRASGGRRGLPKDGAFSIHSRTTFTQVK